MESAATTGPLGATAPRARRLSTSEARHNLTTRNTVGSTVGMRRRARQSDSVHSEMAQAVCGLAAQQAESGSATAGFKKLRAASPVGIISHL
jgi:hypothetical protein